MSLPALSLGDWFSVSRKVGQGEVGWYIHPKSETAGLCVGGLVVKSLSRVIVQMVLENSHLTSQGLHVVCVLISIELASIQVDHQNDRVQSHLQPGAGKAHV